jgi:hypothetical protein
LLMPSAKSTLFMLILPMTRLASYPELTGANGRGTNDDRALRCSTTELRSIQLRQDSNLRPPAPEAKYLLSTPPAKPG